MSAIIDRKGTLVTRPMDRLLEDPHLLSGWLSLNRSKFSIEKGKIVLHDNPFVILAETYEYLNMSFDPSAPAAEVIWSHDNELLQKGLRFYTTLAEKFKLGLHEFDKLTALLAKDKPQAGFSADEWPQIQSAHAGFEAGLELLGILFVIAGNVKFWDFKVEEDLEVTIPAYLHDPDLQTAMKKVLVPPPSTKADEIVSICGGMYYGQEAPGLPAFVSEGMHFEKGQALYIIEVMKMFNTVRATFSGTIDKIIMQGADGSIVQKGQPLFKVTPDEKFVEIDPKELETEKREKTAEYLKAVL
jgi:biotin carboxyl carrier protein